MIPAIVLGYAVGSLPIGYLVAQSAGGVDLRRVGSGNVGATNVYRSTNLTMAIAVMLADMAKGAGAVLLAGGGENAVAAGVAAVFGHVYPVWLRFRGGKGVATSAGVLLGLMPVAVVSVFALWLLLFQLTRYVSVASIGAAIALPIIVGIYLHYSILHGNSLLAFSIIIAGIVVWRHRSNLQRLLRGREQRFHEK